MSSTLEITGKMTMPNAPGGATTQKLIGAPIITPSSTTGAQVTYNEKCEYEFKIAAAATQVVNFGSVADGAFLYIGTDKAVTYKLNGGSEVFSLADGGFAFIKGGTVTALSITAGVVAANVYVLIVGD
jgi:hypothetical protein